MAHETPNPAAFLRQAHGYLKPGGRFLLVEPLIHVSAQAYEHTLQAARSVGFTPLHQPSVQLSRATLLAA